MESESEKAFQSWFEGLQTVDEMFNQLEQPEGPGNKAQGPETKENEG